MSTGGSSGSLLDDLLGGALATPQPDLSAPIKRILYDQLGLTVSFEFSKPQSNKPEFTAVNAMYTNSNPVPIQNFNLQAAVPKVCSLFRTLLLCSVLVGRSADVMCRTYCAVFEDSFGSTLRRQNAL